MAKDVIVAKDGAATVKIDMREAIALRDRISNGAATRFVDNATDILTPIKDKAKTGWPVALRKSNNSARSFFMATRITDTRLAVSIRNNASDRGREYAFKVRYSVRTKASIDAEIARFASGGKTPATQEKIRAFWTKKLHDKHGEGAPSAALAGRNLWSLRVFQPAKKGRKELIKRSRQDLIELAKG